MEFKRAFEHLLSAVPGAEQAQRHSPKSGAEKQQHGPEVCVSRMSMGTSQAVLIGTGNGRPDGVEAFAMQPGSVEVPVPAGWKPGDKVPAQGPHGRVWLELPQTCTAGTTIRYRLRPAPDMCVEVPAGAPAGTMLTFERSDGTRINIEVPQGRRPGQKFEVRPPALMVLVPEGAQPGSHVIFRAPIPGAAGVQWLRAQVPQALQLGRYFAARLPPPGAASAGIPDPEETGAELAMAECPEASEEAAPSQAACAGGQPGHGDVAEDQQPEHGDVADGAGAGVVSSGEADA